MMQVAQNVTGVLLLDKPSGMSSHQLTHRIRYLLGAKKAGHTGTLDPMATGLLPICLDEATKFSSYGLHADKVYHAELRFGVTTTTGDLEGAIIEERAVTFLPQALDAAIAQYKGDQMQCPPMYSALKHQGKPLYAYAREGVTVERALRQITIYDIKILNFARDRASLFIHCSKGTYIRVLAQDIGCALGCGASLSALKRVQVGSYRLDEAVSLPNLEALSLQERQEKLMPAEMLLQDLPALYLDKKRAWQFWQGQRVPIFKSTNGILQKFRVYSETNKEELMGIGEECVLGVLAPIRLMKIPAQITLSE